MAYRGAPQPYRWHPLISTRARFTGLVSEHGLNATAHETERAVSALFLVQSNRRNIRLETHEPHPD